MYHDCPFLNVSHSFFCRSSETRPPEDDEEEEEEILGSDDDEQEDPKDYVKGKTEKKEISLHFNNWCGYLSHILYSGEKTNFCP